VTLAREIDRFRAGKRLWSRAELTLLRKRYPHEPTAAIARDLRRTTTATYGRAQILGLKKSAAYIAAILTVEGERLRLVGGPSRFVKGQVPANKGLRRPGWGPGRMKDTQFKKGHRQGIAARNWRPVGTVLPDPEGYLRIKVREAQPGEVYGFGNPGVWPMLHRHLWEKAHGPIPPGHVVALKNGRRDDVRLDNLELISRRQLMARNTVHNLPKPLARTVQLLGALNRTIRRRTAHEEQDRRPA
jgi:HNH endonuclease